MAHSIIDSKDATGLRSDGTHDTTETDRFTEGVVEDFMRKGYKGGVRTRDFESMTCHSRHPKRCRISFGKKLPAGKWKLLKGKWVRKY